MPSNGYLRPMMESSLNHIMYRQSKVKPHDSESAVRLLPDTI